MRKLLDTLSTAYIISVSQYIEEFSLFLNTADVCSGAKAPRRTSAFVLTPFFTHNILTHIPPRTNFARQGVGILPKGAFAPGGAWEFSQRLLFARGAFGSSPKGRFRSGEGVGILPNVAFAPGSAWEFSHRVIFPGRRGSSPEAEYIRNGGVSA